MRKSGYVIIEGNIGAGKSTFAKALVDALKELGCHAEYLPEPDETTNPYLAKYYEQPKETAYKMQSHLLHKRYTTTQYAQWGARDERGWFIMDRSFFGDLCFANVQRKDGFFDDDEFRTYRSAHHNMRVNISMPTSAIFLDADPSTCITRINQRMTEKEGRKCESTIELSYLTELDQEIKRLEIFMHGKTELKHVKYDDPLTPDMIKEKAAMIARELTKDGEPTEFDTYCPWSSEWDKLFEIHSDLKGLAEHVAKT